MRLHTLYLNQFRLYEQTQLTFCPGINCIYGNNAVGKTTILEAIHYLISGRSFRAKTPAEIIKKGSDGFLLEARFTKHGVEQKIKVVTKGKEKRITYNSTVCQSTASVLGLLQGVMMTPDDTAIIKGAPAVRRQYIDLQLAQADPLYVHHITRYHRAMRQRNALLKAKNSVTIESWELEMAISADYVIRQRKKLIAELTPLAQRIYGDLSREDNPLVLTYKTTAPDGDIIKYYQELFCKMRNREMLFGSTCHGPHKDDLMIAIGGLDTRYYASEGQQRCAVIALRFAEWERLKNQTDELPLMLLDDIGLSLDSDRQKRLFAHLDAFDQVFLTSTVEGKFPNLCKDVHKLHLMNQETSVQKG